MIWGTLLVVAWRDDRLDESQLRESLDRARGQIDALETMRLSAAVVISSRRSAQRQF
ncbi:hypothetical protein [Streptomyces sp. NPDC059909]|uniref:hypothetical protein n=1 Tax=Streptomyces sp. NPDC059909 TaxID=3346998 RepID=UPI003657DEBB